MDAEAHTWITDWGPFVNPVISLAQLVIKPTVWTLEILGLSEPLTALGWQIYKDSVFYGLFSDHPVEDLVERSWISKKNLGQVKTIFLIFSRPLSVSFLHRTSGKFYHSQAGSPRFSPLMMFGKYFNICRLSIFCCMDFFSKVKVDLFV